MLTATCSDSYIENSKNHKNMILPIITSPKCQLLLNNVTFLHLYLLFYYRRSLQLMRCGYFTHMTNRPNM